jgi:hypothetical protein
MSGIKKIKINISKKTLIYLIMIFFLIFILSLTYEYVLIKQRKVDCYNLILDSLNDIGWEVYNENMFVSKSNESTFLILNNNFITMKLENSKDRLNIYFDDNVIYLNENKEKENVNEYEKYKSYLDYDEIKSQLIEVNQKLDKAKCGLYGKNSTALYKYKEESSK